MSAVEERFQAMLAKRKKEKIEVVEKKQKGVLSKKKIDIADVFEVDSSVFNNLTDDKELVKYLEEKSIEMLSIQSKNIILLGKNLTEVFDELGKKGSPEGLYLKYLEFNGYKKDTALRLRKRYELFSLTTDERIKNIISILPVRAIEEFYKDKENILSLLLEEKNDIDYKRAKDIIDSKTVTVKEIKKVSSAEINFGIEKIEDLYEKINNNFNKLDGKKKEKITKLLLEIEKLLS
ncbi:MULTISPECIES: hypothetical protein [Fusobacterium]|uniref:Uncharacterized protein n=1 Tax=Fusobacterium hominis TaxID=2764326 RepID=A0A7G9GYL6_9FUSO|nr:MULTISPECIES: hypothetical protein [Fusobacterium]QNM15898.1 hypothetical protein H9Q81_03425 [Fusobacterium hominis]